MINKRKKVIAVISALAISFACEGAISKNLKTRQENLNDIRNEIKILKEELKEFEEQNKQFNEQTNNIEPTAVPFEIFNNIFFAANNTTDWAREDESLKVSQDTARKLFYSFDK